MPNGRRARYPDRGRAALAGLLAVLLLLGARRPAAAQAAVTYLYGCTAVARYDSRTILVTWRTTQEKPNDQVILTYTVDNGANWLPLTTFYTDGVAKGYSYMDGWQADNTVIGYKAAVRNPITYEIGSNIACLVQIMPLTATPLPTTTATVTVLPTTPTPTPPPTRTATPFVSPIPLASGTLSPTVRPPVSVTPSPAAVPGATTVFAPAPPPLPALSATATVRPATATPSRTPTSVLRRLPASAVTPAADILPAGTPFLLPEPPMPAPVAQWPAPGLLLGLAATLLALAALAAAAGFQIWRRGPGAQPDRPGSGDENQASEGGPPGA